MPPSLLDVPQLIDLALGSPNLGVVNFNLLHTLLHVIVGNMKLDQHRIEFQGSQGVAVNNLLGTQPVEPITELIEYVAESTVDPDGKNLSIQKKEIKKKPIPTEVNTVIVVKKSTELDADQKESIAKVRKPPPGFPIQPINVVDQNDFTRLSQRVDSLHDTLTTILPKNIDIMQCNQTGGLQEMWNLLNMTKRIDALEIGIQKFSSIVNDVANQYRRSENLLKQYKLSGNEISEIKGRVDEISRVLYDEGKLDTVAYIQAPKYDSPTPKSGVGAVPGQAAAGITSGVATGGAAGGVGVGGTRGGGSTELDRSAAGGVGHTPDQMKHSNQNLLASQRAAAITSLMAPEMMAIRKEVSDIQKGLAVLTEYLATNQILPEDTTQLFQTASIDDDIGQSGGTKISGGQTKTKKSSDRKHQMVETKLSSLERQIDDIEKALVVNDSNIASINQSLEQQKEQQNIENIVSKIEANQKNLSEVTDKIAAFRQTSEENKNLIDLLNERCDELQLFKADKDEIEEVLTEKADNKMLTRKLSVDQFEVTKRDLNNSVQMVMNKFDAKELEWTVVHEDLHAQMDSKLDIAALEPFRQEVDTKFQTIHNQLKLFATLRREPEAAGTKMKYLRNVNCLSCDQDVIMKTQEVPMCIPKPQALLPSRSLKPFLSFELSAIRKEMGDLGQGRNLHHYETVMRKHQDIGTVDLNRRHLCSRYCGGSHTAITREQRILKTTNLTTQKPSREQKGEYLVRGIDGAMYRGDEPRDCVCPPMCPVFKEGDTQEVEAVVPNKLVNGQEMKLQSYIN